MEIERDTNNKENKFTLLKSAFKEDKNMYSLNCAFSWVKCLHQLEKVIGIPYLDIPYSEFEKIIGQFLQK